MGPNTNVRLMNMLSESELKVCGDIMHIVEFGWIGHTPLTEILTGIAESGISWILCSTEHYVKK